MSATSKRVLARLEHITDEGARRNSVYTLAREVEMLETALRRIYDTHGGSCALTCPHTLAVDCPVAIARQALENMYLEDRLADQAQ